VTIEILSPHGFCAGVTGALAKAARLTGSVYCLHALVHNELVVAGLEKRGFVFVESLAAVPDGATVLISAHGVAPQVRAEAAARALTLVDATCPFVARVHTLARAFVARGLPVLVVGKAAHVEVKGIVGEVEVEGGRWMALSSAAEIDDALAWLRSRCASNRPHAGVVSQTTMNADEAETIVARLSEHAEVETLAEVCRATKERQDAVKAFAGDALLVLGSSRSSNTRRLCEAAKCRTFRAGTIEEVDALDLTGVETLAVTSGASTPEDFFNAAVNRLSARNML
jgi:4-hydroxy-3-methylbut-2-enyl diphosphate reductase